MAQLAITKHRWPIVPEMPWVVTEEVSGDPGGMRGTLRLFASWQAAMDWVAEALVRPHGS